MLVDLEACLHHLFHVKKAIGENTQENMQIQSRIMKLSSLLNIQTLLLWRKWMHKVQIY